MYFIYIVIRILNWIPVTLYASLYINAQYVIFNHLSFYKDAMK